MDGEGYTRYVAFFRGINVGGKNKVKMVDLKQLFHDRGFRNVKTYIRSGKVILNLIKTNLYCLMLFLMLSKSDLLSRVMSFCAPAMKYPQLCRRCRLQKKT
ncbi:MAG: DUF1697 domain-containing protein [Oscillospiraceae bacterium]|nr:DUF1697 domain-containing protein [Oscillospiraceae bacterium]